MDDYTYITILYQSAGSIPGPPLVGYVIDHACLVWTGGLCGSDEVCSLYSHELLSEGAVAWWITLGVVAVILFTIASCFASRRERS